MSQNQIGTLSEKSTHRLIKNYLEPNEEYHEVDVGNYIADIKRGNSIIEIQTQQFNRLIPKINYYIRNGYSITVVYPLVTKKTLNWIDTESLEVVQTRKSSHTGVIQDIFKELYWIIEYIVNKNICLKIILIDANEYKYLDGYGPNNKNKATKIDKIPTKIIGEINFNSVSDLAQFIPNTLPKEWTVKDFIKHSKCNKRWAGSGIKLLRDFGVITVVRKQGNAYVYSKNFN